MAEKILNTRVLLKTDTLENWNSSTLALKKGEIAIATVAATAGTGLTEPVVMIKIGEDGVKTFKDLPWNFYAKASDVISAAKSESALTAFVNNVIAGAGIATDEAMTALAERVTTAEGEIDTIQGLVGDDSVATQIQNAITALNLADTYAAKTHTHTKSEITDFAHTHVIADVTGLSDSIADAKQAGLDATAALNTYKNTNDAAVKANADAIAAINNADTGILAQAKSYADGKDAAIAAAKNAADAAQADVDALDGKVGTVPDGKTVVGMIAEAQTAATYDDTALKGRVSANETAISKLNSLVGDTAVATQITNAVNSAKTELKGSDADDADSATIAGAKKYADRLDAAMDARVDVLEAAVGTGGSVDTKISDAIGKLDKEDAAVAGKYVSAVSETDGVITVTRAALPDYTDTYAPKTHTHAIADVTGLQDALDGKVDDADFNTLNSKVTTIVGDDVSKSVRTISAEEVAKIVAGADASYDTLKEIADWIMSDTTGAAKMANDIATLNGLVGDKSVAEQIGVETTRAKAAEKANSDAITALDGRLTTAEGEIDTLQASVATNTSDIDTLNGTGEGSVAKAVSDAVAALDVEDTAVDHQVVTAVSETDGKIAVTRAQLSTDDIAAGTEVWIFDCGSSAV